MVPVLFSILLLVIFLGFATWGIETYLKWKREQQKECPHCGKKP